MEQFKTMIIKKKKKKLKTPLSSALHWGQADTPIITNIPFLNHLQGSKGLALVPGENCP